MNLIKAEKIAKIYGAGDTCVQALSDVDLTIQENEFVAIMGQSGSGKTTLLNILSGLDSPTSGKVYIDGQDLYALQEKERTALRAQSIGFVFQQYNLLPFLTAEENICMPLLLGKKKVNLEDVHRLAGLLNISDRLKHLPAQLSGGQQQRVAIARALIAKPRIVFADEPTGNLDSTTGNEVISLLQNCVQYMGSTLVMITHAEGIARTAGRCIYLKDGRIQGAVAGGA